MSRHFLVCMRPNCATPPCVVLVVHHLPPHVAMCARHMVHMGIARTFMFSAGVVCTSTGGTCSFVVDAGVMRAPMVTRVVHATLCPRRCPWFFLARFCRRFLTFLDKPEISTGRLTTPQGPQWWPTGFRIPLALANRNVALQGTQGWRSGCPIPCTPPEGTLGYVTCALAADNTKRRKKMGSSVAYKTIGTFLSQNMGHEDARGWATKMQSSGCAAVRQWPTLSFTHRTCKFDLGSKFIR